MEDIKYPIRINKYLALKKYSTRRGSDEMIQKGLVKINGIPAKLGVFVREGDKVEVAGKPAKYTYVAYYKPKGVITHSPQGEEKSIGNIVAGKTVHPIGRLDKNSHGLIILSDDGRITDRLLNPKYDHEKEYIVKTKDKINQSFVKRMGEGVNIEDYKTKKSKVSLINNFAFRIILSEGKKHQIKRMCVALKNEVVDLKRVRIMNIKLEDLKPGQWREFSQSERDKFLQSLDL